MFVLKFVKPLLKRWLEERALVIPATRRRELAERLRVPVEVIVQVESSVREWILAEVDRL